MDTLQEENTAIESTEQVEDDRPWDDIVFENRNQEYGAYVLRKDYGNNVLFAFTMTILITILLIVMSL